MTSSNVTPEDNIRHEMESLQIKVDNSNHYFANLKAIKGSNNNNRN
jgi:hypothetical protein